MSTLSQKRFSGGEISPALYAGTDLAKYQSGLRTLRNFYVMRHGGAQSRAGTGFVCEVADSTKAVRLIPFVFNSDQTYVLEFGDLYLRVIKNGAQQRLAAQNISAITNANPCVLTYSGSDTYDVGDEIYVSGIVGAIGDYLNERNFKVAAVNAGTNEITLDYMDGSNVNSTSFGAYTSGGTIAEVYELETPYLEADLPELQFVQSADVITIVHPTYPPANLSRTSDTAWTFEPISFAPSLLPPTGLTNSGLASAKINVTAVSAANPAVITTAAHGYSTGDTVQLSRLDFRIQSGLLYKYYTMPTAEYLITVLSATTFTAARVSDGSNFVAPTGYSYTTARYTGKSYRSAIGGTPSYVSEWCVTSIADDTYEESERSDSTGSASTPTSGSPITISWSAATGAQGYNVYRKNALGIFGFIAYTEQLLFSDIGTTPDDTETPPATKQNFKQAGDYPSCVAYYQQRRLFANTDNDPEKVWASRTGFFTNYTVSSPIQDDDAVTFNMAGRQVNEVRHMIDIGKLIVFTAGGEWTINGNSAGTLLPGEVNPKQGSYNGASTLPPIVIGGSAIYVQARGSYVRDLDFDYTVENYRGGDLTIFSSHLVEGFTLVDWAYAQIPNSIVWCVRDDGTMLGLTYVKEQQMLAWHKHDTEGGLIENVCVVPEGSEDVVYLVVNRTIGSSTYRYIERMASRFLTEETIKDFKGLDSFKSYDGRHTGSTTMTLSGSGWTYEDTLTLTASAAYFSSSDIGNSIHLTGADGTLIRCSITAYTSSTVVSVTPHKTVPVGMRAVAITEWAKGVSQVKGLWHLEGMDVSIFADGFVIANPNNDAYDVVTVTNGAISLDDNYTVIHIGLPITADFETLNIDTPQGETIADKHQLVSCVNLFVEKTRGLWAGGAPPDETVDFLDGLTEFKVRNEESYDDPVAMATGIIDVNIENTWNSNGRVFIRQTDPVPATILAIAPSGLFPFRG